MQIWRHDKFDYVIPSKIDFIPSLDDFRFKRDVHKIL